MSRTPRLWDNRPCGCGTCDWCFYLARVHDAHEVLVEQINRLLSALEDYAPSMGWEANRKAAIEEARAALKRAELGITHRRTGRRDET